MVTFNLNQILVSALLVALIVLTVVLIVLAINANKTVKKANTVLDEGITAIDNVKEKYDSIRNIILNNALVTKVFSAAKFVQNKTHKKNK